jgi:peptide deformylase
MKQLLTQDGEFSPLRKPGVEVMEFDDSLRKLVADMWDTMYAERGVGLAASQIGSSLRVAVIDVLQTANSNRRLVMVNPRIESFRGEQTGDEGCLSMPGLRWQITRAAWVDVTYQDLRGLEHRMAARGLFARAVQHECDHLNGVLCNSGSYVIRWR